MAKRRNTNGASSVKNRLGNSRSRSRKKKAPQTHVNPVTKKVSKKTVLSDADFLAAELHQQRVVNMELRKQVLQKNAQILKLQQTVIQKDEQLLAAEEKQLETNNTTLREKHGLRLGETLHKDDQTNEVYYLDEIEEKEAPEPEPEPEGEEGDDDADEADEAPSAGE
jgi:hypothetical protein